MSDEQAKCICLVPLRSKDNGVCQYCSGWTPTVSFQDRMQAVLDSIGAMLVEKNRRYGNSVLEPVRVFSQASPTEQLLVRIDDKLSRIRTTGLEAEDEDTLRDLIGYLVLLMVARQTEER